MNRSRLMIAFAAFVLGAFLCASAEAQTITATLEGRATDNAGAAVAGANVTAANSSTGLSRSAITSDSGEYRISLLPVGEYTVTVDHQGFRKDSKKITLVVGQTATLDFALQAGGVAEQVNVEAAETIAEPTRTELSSVISQRQIVNLPVNGRQFIDFVLLAPGVTIGDTTSGSTDVIVEPVTKISFAGQNIHFNFVAIDGADNISTASGIQKTTPSQDAVQEFRVVNTVYSAEFGRAVGGIVNIITKGGSNEVHGSLYEYFRNDALDARSILSSPGLDTLHQNQFGGTVGGPLKKDRTFYFMNYEGQRRTESPFYNSTVLANIAAINNAKVTRYGLPAENLNVLRDSNGDNFLIKLDHNLSKRHTLAGRYFFNDIRYTNVSPLNDGFDLPSGFKDNFLRDQSVVGNLISIFTPHLYNELRGQYAHRSFDFPTVSTQPHLEVANTFAIGVNRGNPDFYKESRFELVDNVTFTRGNHSIGFGGNYNYVRTTESFPLFYPFEATFASLPDLLSGDPFVIFFQRFRAPNFDEPTLDTSAYLNSRIPDAVRNQAKGVLNHTYDGFFVQDKIRVSSRLTATLGLRYEFETWPKEALDNDFNNFDPRFGFAFNAGSKWNLVFRGGAGIFHGTIPSPLLSCQIPSCGGPKPYPGRENKDDALNSTTGLFAFGADPATMHAALAAMIGPGVKTAVYPRFAPGPGGDAQKATIVRFAKDHQAPYGIQMSFGFEIQPAAGTAFSASYLRVRGVHLGSFFNVNQPDASGTTEAGTPDYAAFRPLASCRPCLLDRRIAVPGFRNPEFGVFFEADSRWNSTYDGLLVNLNQRVKKALSFGISYTFSKTIDDGPNPSFVLIPVNSSRIDLERAVSSDDARHRFVGNATLASPTDANALVRDFQLSFIATLESPHRFTKFAGFDANGDVFGVNDRVGADGRNTFEGDNVRTLDVRVSRSFGFKEKRKLELLAEAFNVLNTLNVRFFNTVYGDSVFHPANSTINDPLLGPIPTFREGALNPGYGNPRAIFNPRQIQFAARFTF
ncbi:MAG TPA: carboxypeptidase regulatory-like domain-containing protein [Blastocatellia bacterium]|nr:carboxypeptidase regulatory-like domain-containing protein [Blastocatellia bacterium]